MVSMDVTMGTLQLMMDVTSMVESNQDSVVTTADLTDQIPVGAHVEMVSE